MYLRLINLDLENFGNSIVIKYLKQSGEVHEITFPSATPMTKVFETLIGL